MTVTLIPSKGGRKTMKSVFAVLTLNALIGLVIILKWSLLGSFPRSKTRSWDALFVQWNQKQQIISTKFCDRRTRWINNTNWTWRPLTFKNKKINLFFLLKINQTRQRKPKHGSKWDPNWGWKNRTRAVWCDDNDYS